MDRKSAGKTSPSHSTLLKSPVAFGKYRLLGRLGRGGMAEVYLARPRGQRRLVAIKCIRKKLAGERQYLDMFVREGKLAVQLNNEAIVKTHEIGHVSRRHFICMEYISGVDLNLILKRCRASRRQHLPVPHALHIAMRACEGLHYAHELNDSRGKSLKVVNRDVSPSNVRLSYDGDVKLLDFGIAKAKSGLSSEIGVVKGKISHMSPEQVRGLPVDRRSDIFATGIVLHEMLTLEKLFRGDSEFQIMDAVRRAEVKPPSMINHRVSAKVDELVLRALHKDPAERYQTADEMADALREVLTPYNFSRAELRDLVRDLCREEWKQEQRVVEICLAGEPGDQPDGGLDEDYGEFLEILEDDDPLMTTAEREARVTPRWMHLLLFFSVLLLLSAVALVVYTRG